jgi:hypothetical protein
MPKGSKKAEDNWLKEELNNPLLGDKRLNERLQILAQDLSKHHQMPINQACEDWSSTKAAYRFFSNEKVTAEKILKPHQEQTSNRIEKERVVLALQDTMYLNFTHHPSKQGFGPIGTEEQALTGLVVHGTLAVTTEGLPLGRLTQEVWAREESPVKKDRQTIAEKESYKWIKALQDSILRKPGKTELITVCDRESDIYEFFVEASKLNTYLLIRSGQNRRLEEELGLLWEHMDKQKIRERVSLKIPAKDKQAGRLARFEMRYEKVMIKSPKNSRNKTIEGSMELTAIWMKEIHPPEGIEGIRWMLLTNLEVGNSQEALTCVEWYKLRWQIELYHKILKSGCSVEKCRLEIADRFIRYFALMSIIAWRLFWMTYINRSEKEMSCTVALTADEWKALYCKIHKTKWYPPTPPTLYEAIRWIASLGGFLGRKNDGEPGIMSIWRGWQRLNDIAESWRIFNAP